MCRAVAGAMGAATVIPQEPAAGRRVSGSALLGPEQATIQGQQIPPLARAAPHPSLLQDDTSPSARPRTGKARAPESVPVTSDGVLRGSVSGSSALPPPRPALAESREPRAALQCRCESAARGL